MILKIKIIKFNQSLSARNKLFKTKVFKHCAQFFAHILTKLYYFCIRQSVKTNDWKHAIISSLFKGKGMMMIFITIQEKKNGYLNAIKYTILCN